MVSMPPRRQVTVTEGLVTATMRAREVSERLQVPVPEDRFRNTMFVPTQPLPLITVDPITEAGLVTVMSFRVENTPQALVRV